MTTHHQRMREAQISRALLALAVTAGVTIASTIQQRLDRGEPIPDDEWEEWQAVERLMEAVKLAP